MNLSNMKRTYRYMYMYMYHNVLFPSLPSLPSMV